MKITNLDIPIFYGSISDITKIDIGFINCQIVTLKGIRLRKFLKNTLQLAQFKNTYEILTEDSSQYLYEDEIIKIYAVIPLDIQQSFTLENIFHFNRLILSIYPSNFSLVGIMHFELFKETYQSSGKTIYHFSSNRENSFDNFMNIPKQELSYANAFIKKHFFNSFKLNYVKYMMQMYNNSFHERNPIFQYLSLIICLEVIVVGNEQLSYKLRRNTALLCGTNIEICKRIYSNVNELYKFRSTIVHGNINPKFIKFKKNHEYLKNLVAKLIRELIVHNISTIEELNDTLTTLGFGQYKLISKNYLSTKNPLIQNMQVSYTDLNNSISNSKKI